MANNRFGLSDSLISAVRDVCNERVATKEELKGDQHKLDVAEPKGKLTSADFKKLQAGKEQVNVKPDLPESMHSIGSKDRITRENPWVTIHKGKSYLKPTDSGYEKGAPALIGSMGLNAAAKIHGFKIDPESIHKAGVGKKIPVKNRDGKEMFVALSPHHAKASRAAVSALGSTNEEVERVNESNRWSSEFPHRIGDLEDHGDPKVKKHLNLAKDNFRNGKDPEAAEYHMREAEKAARASKQVAKEEVEQVDEATNIKNISGVEKISSHGRNFDLYRKKTDPTDHLLVHRETGEIHHGFSGKTKDVERFLKNYKSVLKDYEFEHLPRPAKEEVEQVDEREMTAPEMKKREKIVMSMKKNLAGFKERYGKRGKDVMYATATKMAMKDED